MSREIVFIVIGPRLLRLAHYSRWCILEKFSHLNLPSRAFITAIFALEVLIN